MKGKMNRVARGALALSTGLLVIFTGAYGMVDSYRSTIDMYLNTKSEILVTDSVDEGDDLYAYKVKDECSTTEKLVQYHIDLNRRIEAEGCVLLKNDNDALPLGSSEKSLTLIGNCSYRPWKGGLLGSRAASGNDGIGNNEMPGANVVDLVAALEEKDYSINPDMAEEYADKRPGGAAYMEIMDLFTLGNTYTTPGVEEKAYNALGLFSEKDVSGFASDSALSSAAKEYGTAIVTIGRPGSEAMSYAPGAAGKFAPDYIGNDNDVLGLSNPELSMLDYASKNYEKVIVLLNTPVAMDLPELDDYADAILWIGCPNDYGFRGVVDVLDGTVSPSGHLTDTYAAKASVSPAMTNYGMQVFTDVNTADQNAFVDANYTYQAEMESIYVGYKYYESRYYDSVFGQNNATVATPEQTADGGTEWNYDDEVVWSFGEGYSYTTFSETLKDFSFTPSVKDGQLTGSVSITVDVTNTGDRAGKHVVQLYMQAPYTKGGIEKSAIQLAGYGKTGIIQPGKSEEVTITVDATYLTSWDMEKQCYVLEAGTYYFATGNGAHDALNNIIHEQDASKAAGTYGVVCTEKIGQLDVTHSKAGAEYKNQLNMAIEDYGVDGYHYLSRTDWNGTWPETVVMARTQEMWDGGLTNSTYTVSHSDDTSHIIWGADTNYRYTDLKPEIGQTISFDDERLDILSDQVTLDEAVLMFIESRAYIQPIASIGQPMAYEDDGPTGFSVYKLGTNSKDGLYKVNEDDPYFNFTMSTLPVAVVIGSTWSHELVEEAGEMVGNDSIWSGNPLLWGPASNIHRTPYNARNVEYYSEDGVLSGMMVDDFAKGAKEYGCIVMDKHFAFNDTEMNRAGIAPFMTEQAARENELRAFQISIESGNLLGLMTAYNRVGACYSSAHLGLMQGILRNEWGFKGIAISDLCGMPNYMSALGALAAGTDLMLCEGTKVLDTDQWTSVNASNIANDATLQGRLKEAVKHVEYVLLNSNFMNGVNGSSHLVRVYPWYDITLYTLIAVAAAGIAASLAINVIAYVKNNRKTKNNPDMEK